MCVNVYTYILEDDTISSEKKSPRLNTSDLKYYINQYLCLAYALDDPFFL